MSFQWIASDVQTPIVELRRYRLRPGRFEDFIELFETRFIEQGARFGEAPISSATCLRAFSTASSAVQPKDWLRLAALPNLSWK